MSNGSDGCRGEQITLLHLRKMRGRYNIPERTKSLSEMLWQTLEGRKILLLKWKHYLISFYSINQRTGEKKTKYCGNFELTCQCIYMDTAEATEICSAIDARSANINIMLFFVEILVCALIDIGKS